MRCDECGSEREVIMDSARELPPCCLLCGSAFTKVVWLTMPTSPKGEPDEHDLKRNIPVEPLVFSKQTQKKRRT